MPVIPNITKGWNEYNIRKNFDKILAASRPKGILAGNLGWIEPYAQEGVNVFADYGVILEAAFGGRIPVMTSKHCFLGALS